MDLIRTVKVITGFCACFVRSLFLLKKRSALENRLIAPSTMACKITVFAQISAKALYFSVIGAAKMANPKLSCQGSL